MQKILVGVDASDRAPEVLRAAIDLAKRNGARLFVLRAVGLPVEFPIEAMTDSPEGLPARLLAATERSLDALVLGVPQREPVERIEARIGTPWQVLCDAARELDADLVVIGTHGHSALDRLLGTTAARVVNHAPCSVLVVRPKSAAAP